MGDDSHQAEAGAILVEYGMILLVILLVVFALVGVVGGHVADIFDSVLPGFG